MSDYNDRLLPIIRLTSPGRADFEALWADNPRLLERSLVEFKFPGSRGVEIQDLGTGAVRHEIELFFQGKDYDITTRRFFEESKNAGQWVITHPIVGTFSAYMKSCREDIAAVKKGRASVLISLIEVVTFDLGISAAQRAAEVASTGNDLNEEAADRNERRNTQRNARERGATVAETNRNVAASQSFLSSLYSRVAEVNARITANIQEIQAALLDPVLDIVALTGQIQTLIQTPALIAQDFESRINAYRDLVTGVISGLNTGENTPSNLNAAHMAEVTLAAAVGAVSTVMITGDLQSRREAIELIDTFDSIIEEVIDGLDTVQAAFQTVTIDQQYFTMNSTFPQIMKLRQAVVDYLLKSSFDLAVERTVVIDRPRNPVELALELYGSPGENDSNIDKFYTSNNLTGNNTLLLPALTEVVVYG